MPNTTAIATETTRATSAEKVNSDSINKEITDRTTADTTLNNTITSET